MPQATGLRIGELATRSGVTPDALRYYERLGLIPHARRTAGGFRVYGPDAQDRIRFIKQAQAHGLSLADIRELLAFRDRGGRERCRHVQRLLGTKIAELDSQLVQLQEFRRTLKSYVDQCQQTLSGTSEADCPVVAQLGRSET